MKDKIKGKSMNELMCSEKIEFRWWLLAIITFLYSISFLFLFYLSFLSLMIFSGPNISILKGWSFVFLCLSIPLAIPISLCFMWSKYSQSQYLKAYFYCIVPLIIFKVNYFLIRLFYSL